MRTILDVRSDHFLDSEDWLCNLTGFGRVTSEGSKKIQSISQCSFRKNKPLYYQNSKSTTIVVKRDHFH